MHYSKNILFPLLILIIVSFCRCNIVETKAVAKKDESNIDTTICTPDGSFKVSEYIVANNCRGKGSITNFSQSVNVKFNAKGMDLGFNWQWPSNINNNVKAYPEIIFGWKPWSNLSTTELIPIRVSASDTICVSYDNIETNFNGVGNTSLDIYITSSQTPSVSLITKEIMIWVKNYGQIPRGSQIASVNIDGVEYDLYIENMNWTCLTFVNQYNTNITNVNIHKFLEYLILAHYITNSEFLSSIEFGNEIVSGTGSTTIKNFQIQIKPVIGVPL